MADRFWVGGTGNWSDNTNHWSATSGGSPGASKPTSADNVYFDENSFSASGQVVTINEAANCLNMDWTGANSPTLAGSSNLNIYGDLTFISAMSCTMTGYLYFKGTLSRNINTANINMTTHVALMGTVGTEVLTLQSDLTCGNLEIYKSIIALNGKIVNCASLVAGGTLTRGLDMTGSPVLNASGSITMSGTGMTLTPGTSTIIMTGNSKTFAGGGLTYHNVRFSDTPTTVTGANTFNTLTVDPGKTCKLTAGTTQTASALEWDGANIQSSTAGAAATVSVASGTVEVTGATIKDITATGGATFNAIDCIDSGGNTGWNFYYTASGSTAVSTTASGDGVIGIPASGSTVVASSVSGKACKVIRSGVANNAVSFFTSNNTVYIMDGAELYQWGGSGPVAVVTGYVPTVYTAAPPTGGGTMLESLNYLTGSKTQKFSGNNSDTIYQLAELDIETVDSVYVGGVLQQLPTDYTVNLTNGTVTFTTHPPTGVNNVVITWTKTVAGDRETITKNRYYGGVYYARYWIFGNPDHKNTRYPSGVTMAGASDPSFWPKFAESDVGEYEITDIVTQYSKQLIFTSGDSAEASAWYSEEEDYTDPTTGAITALFPVYPMNAKIGNVAKGQVQVIMNNPLTIWKGVYEWISTYVMNEKNAKWISKRIQNDLDEVDLTTALTVDWSDKGQYWLCVGKTIWVLNYRTDTWHILELPDAPTCFCLVEDKLYFGTTAGQIMKFDEDLRTYNGSTIKAKWEMGFFNFGVEWLRKFIQRIFVTILPRIKTHVEISYVTDRSGSSDVYTAEYSLSNFDHADFNHWSFETNYSPQPFKFKIKAKKIDYFKLVIENNDTDTATVLSITIPSRTGGEIRNRR
jgi:hypothetical protein